MLPCTFAFLSIANSIALTPKTPTIINKDTVPFRYTPNIQTFIGEVGLEGLFSCAIMAVARCLSEPEVAYPKCHADF
jgi:hypothetical protein